MTNGRKCPHSLASLCISSFSSSSIIRVLFRSSFRILNSASVSCGHMEDGKQVVDVGKGDGVVDVVGKLGSEVEGVRGRVEEEGNIDGATSEVEVQVRENCESGEKVWEGRGSVKDYSGNNGTGINDGEDVKEVASDDAEVNVDGKVEGESEGVWSDEVLRLEVKEEVEQTEVAGAAEGIQIVAASDGKEVRPEEASDVKELKEQNGEGEFQQSEETVVQEETKNQDAEIQVEDAAIGTTDHNCGENFENVPEAPSYATVNGVLGAGVAESNAIIENDGDKLDVLSQVDFDTDVQPENGMSQMDWTMTNEKVDHDESKENNFETPEKQIQQVKLKNSKADEEQSNPSIYLAGDESGTEEEQIAFFREVEAFFKARGTDFRPPKFYGEPLNLLKLWRAVIRLGGYEQVTSCKLWRQIGESFNPPKTCTTVSWTFRLFYEKALLEFEKHKMRDGDLPNDNSYTEFDTETQSGGSQGLASGRVMRDSAARAMQGWHSQRNLSNGEIGDPIIKDKSLGSTPNREKLTKSNVFAYLKRKTTSPIEHPSKLARSKSPRPQMEISVIDAGEPANWVKINIRKTKDCFEIYALVPGLTREEVRVQSDPAGRLVISGEPQQLDNPWGVKPFKKVVSLPSRIDPHQTSAVVTLHGQLFVRVPFEPSDEH